jgi:hypothetical protein
MKRRFYATCGIYFAAATQRTPVSLETCATDAGLYPSVSCGYTLSTSGAIPEFPLIWQVVGSR